MTWTPRQTVLVCAFGILSLFTLAMLGVIGRAQPPVVASSDRIDPHSIIGFSQFLANINLKLAQLESNQQATINRVLRHDANLTNVYRTNAIGPQRLYTARWRITTNWLVEPKDRMLLGPFPRTQRFLEYGIVQSNLVAELVYGGHTNLVTLESHPQQSITREYDVTISPRP